MEGKNNTVGLLNL